MGECSSKASQVSKSGLTKYQYLVYLICELFHMTLLPFIV